MNWAIFGRLATKSRPESFCGSKGRVVLLGALIPAEVDVFAIDVCAAVEVGNSCTSLCSKLCPLLFN